MLNHKIVSTSTKILGIIGYPISHSMSPIMHNLALNELNLDYVYVAFEVHPKNLKFALKGMQALNVQGINVTLPHKERVLQYLDEIDPLVKKIGAANTIKLKDGLLFGRNTDAKGAKLALKGASIKLSGINVLVIGSGGAAKAISHAIIDEVHKLTILNRTKNNAKLLAERLKRDTQSKVNAKKLTRDNLAEEIKKTDLLINATPIGMPAYQPQSIISQDMLHESLTVFDMIYNPLETQLIKDAKQAGCRTLNGLDMLINQGALAFEWWTGKKPNINLIKKKLIEILGEKGEN